jgi:hypothetical protein
MRSLHLLSLLGAANAFVATPKGLDAVLSEKFPGAKISYKPVGRLSETTTS